MNNFFEKIGFIGIGLMGYSFVKRLQEAKYHVHVYDKDKNRLKLLNNLKNISSVDESIREFLVNAI